MDKLLRAEIINEVRRAEREAHECYEERWVTDKTLEPVHRDNDSTLAPQSRASCLGTDTADSDLDRWHRDQKPVGIS